MKKAPWKKEVSQSKVFKVFCTISGMGLEGGGKGDQGVKEEEKIGKGLG